MRPYATSVCMYVGTCLLPPARMRKPRGSLRATGYIRNDSPCAQVTQLSFAESGLDLTSFVVEGGGGFAGAAPIYDLKVTPSSLSFLPSQSPTLPLTGAWSSGCSRSLTHSPPSLTCAIPLPVSCRAQVVDLTCANACAHLQAMTLHSGGIAGGHYHALCCNSHDGQWCVCVCVVCVCVVSVFYCCVCQCVFV
jgi:hypothetical protein